VDRARRRIRREAEVLAGLEHPNVVRLLDVVDEGGEVVLVMPYLTGGTLADRVGAPRPAPAEEVERLAAALLGALAAAHRAGVVHRDIKPGNVLFDQAGTPTSPTSAWPPPATSPTASPRPARWSAPPPSWPPSRRGARPRARPPTCSRWAPPCCSPLTGKGPYGRGDPRLLLHRAAKGKVDHRPPHRSRRSLRRLLQQMLDTAARAAPHRCRAGRRPRGHRGAPRGAVRGGAGHWPARWRRGAGGAGRRRRPDRSGVRGDGRWR
jgi:eukaryotic-like serine/threonine-protein kinase